MCSPIKRCVLLNNEIEPAHYSRCRLEKSNSVVGRLARQDQRILVLSELCGRSGSLGATERDNGAPGSIKAH